MDFYRLVRQFHNQSKSSTATVTMGTKLLTNKSLDSAFTQPLHLPKDNGACRHRHFTMLQQGPVKYGRIWRNLPLRVKALACLLAPVPALAFLIILLAILGAHQFRVVLIPAVTLEVLAAAWLVETLLQSVFDLRQASWEQIINFASIPLVFIGGWPGFAIQQGAAIATPLAFRKLSRDAEAEADMLGIQYLYKTGYDPSAFVDFFEKMARQEKSKPGKIAGMLAVHPALLSRIRAVQKQIQKDLNPQPLYLIQTSEFTLVKERLISIENGKRVPWKCARPSTPDERPVLRRRD